MCSVSRVRYRSISVVFLLFLLILPVCANVVAVGNISAIVFQGSYIRIDPAGTRHVDEKITITATTDLPVGSEVLFEIAPSPGSLTRTGTAGQYSGASGAVTVFSGQERDHNRLDFPVDLSTFQPGIYTILATAVKNDITGSGQFTVAPRDVANKPPLPVFTFKPEPAIVNEPVLFDGTGSRDPDGKIISWQWDFGDGTPLTSHTGSPGDARSSHTYRSTGTYKAGLKVMDNSEQFVWTYGVVEVVIPVPPVADFSMSPASGRAYENHPLAVSLEDKSTGSPRTWAWYVDDILVSQLRTYSQSIFTKPGNYTIRLVVTNEFGLSEQEKQVTVKPFETSTTTVPTTTITQATVQPTTTITSLVTTRAGPCLNCDDPCALFLIPCLWIVILIILIILIPVLWYVREHWPQGGGTTSGPIDPPGPTKDKGPTETNAPPPTDITIEARGGISPRGLDVTDLDIHLEVEAGIQHHDKEG